jgi:hypothetical protein
MIGFYFGLFLYSIEIHFCEIISCGKSDAYLHGGNHPEQLIAAYGLLVHSCSPPSG